MRKNAKKLLSLVLALCLTLALLPTTALASSSSSVTAENVLGVLNKYDPDAYHIMKTEYDRGTDFMFWFFGGSLISQIDTAVHETYHSYTFHQAGSFYGEKIYLGNGKSYDVDYSIVYRGGNFTKTEEMSRNIPSNLQTFRYDTYVAPGADPDANTKGVFGLLNEFTAYCWGLETMNSLAQYLLDTDAGAEGWRAYVTSVGNNITAYSEFKYWTLRYMTYIQSANPTLYQSILNNTAYCEAYRDADAKFTAEIDRSRSILNSCREHLLGKGLSVEWTDSGLFLRNGYSGTGLSLDDYSTLMAELAKTEYTQMDAILKKNTSAAPVQPTTPGQSTVPATAPADPTNDRLTVNGIPATPAAYKIEGANYFKLRDLAALLNGTGSRFAVDYDSTTRNVTIVPGQPYEKLSGDLQGKPTSSGTASLSGDAIYVNGEKAPLTIYKIDNSNFVKLRDLGILLDFYVDYENGTMIIDTSRPYSK